MRRSRRAPRWRPGVSRRRLNFHVWKAAPWRRLAHLSKRDALAIVTHLKTVPKVSHQVPGPFGPRDTPSVFVMAVLPGTTFARLPAPGAPPKP